MPLPTVEIPNRSLFRQPEVCDIAQVQPYVLRSWEAEFPDLGVAKTAGGPRVYRRQDLERVLRLKHLLFVEGLTLAGARRKLDGEARPPVDDAAVDFALLFAGDARERLRRVRRRRTEIRAMLAERPSPAAQTEAPFELQEPAAAKPRARKKKAS